MKKLKFRRVAAVVLALVLAVILVSTNLPPVYTVEAAETGSDTFIATPTQYQDAEGAWHLINNEIVGGVMDEDDYTLSILQSTFDAGRIVEFSVGESYVRFQPMPLQWTNDLDMIEQIVIPQEVEGVVTNTEIPLESGYYEGSVGWTDAYGTGRHFSFTATRNRLSKLLTVDSLLPGPAEYIVNGGNPVLRLSFIFALSTDLDVLVDGIAWDKKTKKSTFEAIEFHKDGEYVWRFDPAAYWDGSDEEEQVGITTLRQVGSDFWVDVLVPYEWLLTAQYPVYIDPDVVIDAGLYAGTEQMAARGGVFWTSPLIGYVVYVDALVDLKYRKTTDGGANWSGVNLLTGRILAFDSWADWQTPGDAGTVIHIACIDADTDDVLYFYIDTSDDSTGPDKIEDCQGTGALNTGVLRARHGISITKAKGGNLAVSFYYMDSDAALLYGFYTSPDADTWTSKTDPREINTDHLLLFPGNEVDTQDLWASYWDASADRLSLKTFDNSGNSWSESIFEVAVEKASYLQMDGAIRLSDGHLILANWNAYDSALATLAVWDINGAGSITAKTNVLTNSAESFLTSVFINQANDDIYVAYARGTTVESLVKVYYKKSEDGGANWGSETAMQANAEDDERWISCGAMKKAWGGKFLPVWYNDDLYDLFCNTDNGITIEAVIAPTAITQAASSVGATSARINGKMTDDGGESCEARFRWRKAGEEASVSTVGTTTLIDSIRVSPQRNSFYAAGRFWVFYAISATNDLVYRTSTDGTTWGSAIDVAPLPVPNGANFDTYFDGTYIHYARNYNVVANRYLGIMYRRGTPQSDGTISWSAAEQTVDLSMVADDVSLCVDSDGYPWIAYGASWDLGDPTVITSSTNDGTWSTKSGYPYTLLSAQYFLVFLVLQTDGKIAAIISKATNFIARIQARFYNGVDTWSAIEYVTPDSNDGKVSVNTFSMICGTGIDDEVYLVYRSFSNKIQYIHGTSGSWSGITTLADSVATYTSPVICADGSNLYVFWLSSDNHVYYRKYSGSWEDVVDWIDESTDTFPSDRLIQCFYKSYDGKIGVSYQTEASPPYNVRFALLAIAAGEWTITEWQNTLETNDEYYEDLTELDQGTEYEFQTQAKNSVGEGDWSAEETFETEGGCSPSIEISVSTWDVNSGGPVDEDTIYSTGLTWCTITNNSGGAVTITVGGADLVGGGYTWDLSDDGSNGDMVYGMYAGLEGVSYNIVVKESSPYNTLKSGLADEGTQAFGLQIETPTVFDDGNEKSGIMTLTVTCD